MRRFLLPCLFVLIQISLIQNSYCSKRMHDDEVVNGTKKSKTVGNQGQISLTDFPEEIIITIASYSSAASKWNLYSTCKTTYIEGIRELFTLKDKFISKDQTLDELGSVVNKFFLIHDLTLDGYETSSEDEPYSFLNNKLFTLIGNKCKSLTMMVDYDLPEPESCIATLNFSLLGRNITKLCLGEDCVTVNKTLKAIGSLVQLRHLEIPGCHNISKFQHLETLTCLEVLKLSAINDPEAEGFDSIGKLPLQHLSLTDSDSIGQRALDAIFQPKLKSVVLNGCSNLLFDMSFTDRKKTRNIESISLVDVVHDYTDFRVKDIDEYFFPILKSISLGSTEESGEVEGWSWHLVADIIATHTKIDTLRIYGLEYPTLDFPKFSINLEKIGGDDDCINCFVLTRTQALEKKDVNSI